MQHGTLANEPRMGKDHKVLPDFITRAGHNNKRSIFIVDKIYFLIFEDLWFNFDSTIPLLECVDLFPAN